MFDEDALPVMAPVRPVPEHGTAGEAAVSTIERAVAAGAEIIEVDGYDPAQVADLVAAVRSGVPRVVVAVRAQGPQVAEAAADAGADLLTTPPGAADSWLTEVAAAHGTGLAVASATLAEDAVAAGVRPDSVLVDVCAGLPDDARGGVREGDPATVRSAVARLPGILDAGWPVLVTLPDEEPLARTLAAAGVFAWLGARVFRTDSVAPARQALDMAATIRGTRGPALSRRGLV